MSDYAAITYEHPSILVRYPHLKRLDVLAEMISDCDRTNWLDYGSGDGEIFNALARKDLALQSTVAYEPVPEMFEALEANVAELRQTVDLELTTELPSESFSLVTAFEVLEHLPLPERLAFYKILINQTTGTRDCIIEVPVEFGPILLVKAAGRVGLKRRAPEYSTAGLLRTGVLGKVDDHHNRYDPDDSRTFISPHQGFDLRRLRSELELLGDVVSVQPSPFKGLPRVLNQCVMIHLRITATDEAVLGTLKG